MTQTKRSSGERKLGKTIRLPVITWAQAAALCDANGESEASLIARLIDRAHVARFGEAAPQDGAELAAMWKGKAK